MKALPIIILAAFLFSGCSQQDMESFSRAARGAMDGYYGRPYTPTPVVVQPTQTYYGY